MRGRRASDTQGTGTHIKDLKGGADRRGHIAAPVDAPHMGRAVRHMAHRAKRNVQRRHADVQSAPLELWQFNGLGGEAMCIFFPFNVLQIF